MTVDKITDQFQLVPHLGLAAADELASMLKSQRGSDITIDASKVEHLGAQCLQILLSAARTWHADRKDFALVSPSNLFQESLTLLGVSENAFEAKDVSP